jgi:hypothetical protein
MTEPIAVEFNGDCWNNPARFQQQIDQHPAGEPLVLDLRSEGPSLGALGVTDVIDTWLTTRHLSPETVHLTRWNNPVEFVPYQRIKDNRISHFFFMVRDYWQSEISLAHQQLFGLFIGRMTLSRAVILYQVYGDNVFTSLMNHIQPLPWKQSPIDSHNLENLSDWMSSNDQYKMFSWYDQNPVSSVDNKSVRDQFVTPTSYSDTNASLLQHYHNFAVEIVCETYTLGDTFFPTEKTVRPIMAAKPIVVYAPCYYLARLRSLGFRTYHTVWDESYDLYQGPARWHLMQKSMRTLMECNQTDQHQILKQANEIAMYNRQHLSKICNHQIDLRKHDYTRI